MASKKNLKKSHIKPWQLWVALFVAALQATKNIQVAAVYLDSRLEFWTAVFVFTLLPLLHLAVKLKYTCIKYTALFNFFLSALDLLSIYNWLFTNAAGEFTGLRLDNRHILTTIYQTIIIIGLVIIFEVLVNSMEKKRNAGSKKSQKKVSE